MKRRRFFAGKMQSNVPIIALTANAMEEKHREMPFSRYERCYHSRSAETISLYFK